MDCIWANLNNVGPPFFQILRYVSLYVSQNVIYTAGNHSQLLCGHDFANERLLVCQFDV